MTVRDYADLWATEIDFRELHLPARAQEDVDAMGPSLSSSLLAVRNAVPLSRRFPLVIYAPSFSAVSWENADLCEYLASHGYLVLASPSMGADGRPMTADLAGVDAQARDASFLIDFAKTLPDADVRQIAVVGYSWGGLSSLLAASRDRRISVLVSLDGSQRYVPGLVRRSREIHPREMTLPLLYFSQQHYSPEYMDRYSQPEDRDGPSVLNAWGGELFSVWMLGLVHQEFSAMQQRSERMWEDFSSWQQADYGRTEGATGYAWVARYTLAFLDAYLRQDVASKHFLMRTPAENGVPRHVMGIHYRGKAELDD